MLGELGEIFAVYVLLAVTVALFVADRIRHDIVGLLILAVIGLLGILEPKELLAGFGNQALVTIAAMFVLSAGLMRSGMVNALGGKLTELSRGSPKRFLVLALLAVCFMSAFINNTPVVVVFIPAVLTVCSQLGESPSKFLMPISFASMLGGSCTLIGTSSNILVSSLSYQAGHGEIGMFEFAGVGLVVVAVGMVYLVLFSQRFLPVRTTIASTLSAEDVKEYITQVHIGPESHLTGSRLADTPLAEAGVKVAELIRGDRIQRLEDDMVLQLGDILLVRGDLNKILELERQHEISIAADDPIGDPSVRRVEMTLFELMVAPESRLIGRTCRQIGLRDQFGVSVFALQRRGRHHQREIADLELRMGDILLVRGTMEDLAKLRNSDAFILLEGVHDEVIERHKAPVAVATLLAIVILAALSIFPISVLALAGAAVLVLTRTLTPRDAYRSIDWPVLVLIAGMIALGEALGKTGALDVAAQGIFSLLSGAGEGSGPFVTLWVFYFLTAALSLLILNKPAAVLCAPLGMLLAEQWGVDAKPFIMAVAFAASTAMATPMGYQTNLLVYGPGGYNYRDFVTFGMPLNLAVGVIACLIIPVIWPFYP